ncbi:MAG: hypothetical protein IPN67_02145 [Bacteroidales bacterium]|nr:hypothetical protein [Bacteroidales bacterium]MBK8881203.1 hypothetical protein [Bacteroidales bacterium]
MNKQFLYKILLVANITIAVLLLAFLIIFVPTGKTLILVSLMTLTACLGAIAMVREIRSNKDPKR